MMAAMNYGPPNAAGGALTKGSQVPKYDLKLGLPGLPQILTHHSDFPVLRRMHWHFHGRSTPKHPP